jgi:hypothetical protein
MADTLEEVAARLRRFVDVIEGGIGGGSSG